MGAAALTVVSGYSDFWFGDNVHHVESEATQVIQGIVNVVGFLGAGVILKEGQNISGLTTAGYRLFAGRFEQLLPACPAVAVLLWLRSDAVPTPAALDQRVGTCGCRLASGSLSMMERSDQREWRFAVVALSKAGMAPRTDSTKALLAFSSGQLATK